MGAKRALTARVIERAKPKQYTYSIADTTRGLRVSIRPHGTKTFIYRYQLDKTEHSMTLGHIDDMTLEDARKLANEARKLTRQRFDPLEVRRAQVQAEIVAEQQAEAAGFYRFGEVALAWLASREKHWSERHHRKPASLLNTSLLHKLSKVPIAALGPRQAPEGASRVATSRATPASPRSPSRCRRTR